ncbi:hypothetical protein CN487_09320 [Bacillus cereus]|nr:hypothetical protein CN487_09320 [Bacillus cereus]
MYWQGSVAKFLNREKVDMIAAGFYTIVSNCCNSLYVEKKEFGCRLHFRSGKLCDIAFNRKNKFITVKI